MKIIKVASVLTVLLFTSHFSQGQKTKSASSKNRVSISVIRGYSQPQSIDDVKDVSKNSETYNALKEIVERYHVTIIYDDYFFRGNDNLKRGDFVVSFASALESIRTATKNAMLDTVLVNTYDRNKAYINSVSEIKDVKPGSIYYPSVRSLLEDWGINAPFTKAGVLNAQSLFYEDELYDILRVTLGYRYSGILPKKTPVKRNRFAIILDNALDQKMKEIDELNSQKQAKENAEKAKVDSLIKQTEQTRRDSISKEIEERKIEAQKKEYEARKKLSEKKVE